VAFFKHILDFKRAALARLRDKRKAARYAVAHTFPAKANISLAETDILGRRSPEDLAPGKRRTWGGALLDISKTGVSLQMPPAAVTLRGERTTLALAIDGQELRLPCTVAHFRSQAGTGYCGLALKFEDDEQRKSYLQLLEAVSLSATLVPLKKKVPSRHPLGFKAQQFKSVGKLVLTTWRDGDDQLDSFELMLDGHCLRGELKHPTLAIFAKKGGDRVKTAWADPSYGLSRGPENPEVRKLYRWISLNLPKTVPSDARELMRLFANARTDWKAPPVKAKA